MNILMLTKFVPLPANSGGKRRSLAVLQRLAAMGNVTLCAFREPASDLEGLREMGITVHGVEWRPRWWTPVGLIRTGSLSAARFWDLALADVARARAFRGVDHLQIEYTQLAPYGEVIRSRHRALDMHNIESSLARSFTAARAGIRSVPYTAEAAALRRLERRAASRYDVISVVSEADRDRLIEGSARVVIAPNGWDPSARPLPPAKQPVAAFVGLLGWPPNADAATWLAAEIWPRVRRDLPEARLLLVGRDPAPAVRALDGASGIEVTGTVADVQPYLASARVGLAPLRAGGGSRLKILESLDAGRPVVATAKGAEGLEDLVGEGVEIQDDPAAFAASVVRLLSNPDEARRLGEAGHAAVAALHSWAATLDPLIEAIEAGLPGGKP